ncbi:MAG: Gfo/Idh/MocA family oxidoreductase [Pyrinomonadaceae bacterium]|nr:Gfo/Idh/MocA family oxidoreductase [Pyrinomonadaceae bacterium]
MKQILQNLQTGRLAVVDVPPPAVQPGRVLVRTAASLISAGTERMAVELGRKSLIGKAAERPDLVRQVMQKAKSEGVMSTIQAVRAKLDSSTALGYSAAGIVAAIGEDVTEFRVSDRVACAGAGFASHAEMLSVPKNLCVRVPETVDFEAAAFGTLGAIALQGVRLAEPTLGESIVVIGLGLLGQITVQLLKANGCRVYGIDLDPRKVELARRFGAEGSASNNDTKQAVMEWTRGRGADAVLITAATQSNEPVELAGEVSRLKGRVVVVGLVGMSVPRKVYYERELALKISMSYGPGRYDPEYEDRGHDYPFAYVRWTEGRNIEAFLDLLAERRINVEPLITHRFPIEEGEQAYQLITGEMNESYLGVVLSYDTGHELKSRLENNLAAAAKRTTERATSVRVGLIGAGNYARKMLLPNFKAAGAAFQTIASGSGVTAQTVGERYGFRSYVSSADEVIADEEVNLVVIATRHNLHASLAAQALRSNRHVFVEKPLALNDEELNSLLGAATESRGCLMVGFNRRFSPLAIKAKEFFANRQAPLSILYRVNAGRIPREHWIQDAREGGGRIIGEVCHFIDLMQFWISEPPVRVYAERIASRNYELIDEDSVFITLRFADGSNGSVAYLAEGDRALAKERIEIYGEGRTFVLDDFRRATQYSNGRATDVKLRSQDKGQTSEVRTVCDVALNGGAPPITLDELAATTRATFRIRESLQTGQAVDV